LHFRDRHITFDFLAIELIMGGGFCYVRIRVAGPVQAQKFDVPKESQNAQKSP
jgi:hypothetical protein